MSTLPWFRMYTEAIDDEKLRLLAFEDRWHFVALLCCKGQGILDDASPLMMRKVAVKLGLDLRTLEDVARRLAEVELINQATLQPIAWDNRQHQSDTSRERTRAYRERMKRHSDVTVTAQEVDTDTETDKEEEKEQPIAPAQEQAVVSAPAKKSKPAAIELPTWLSADTWGMWDEFRRAKSGKGWTAGAKALSIRELGKLHATGNEPQAVIEQSIQRGWTGLFEVKQSHSANPANQSPSQRRSNWSDQLNAELAKHLEPQSTQAHDLGVFDASGNRI